MISAVSELVSYRTFPSRLALPHDMFYFQGRCISQLVVFGRTDGPSLSPTALENTHVDIVTLNDSVLQS